MDGRLTFTSSTGTTYSNYTKLPSRGTKPSGLQSHHPQTVRITAEAVGDPSSGSNTLRFVNYSKADAKIRGAFDATITWGTIRTGVDGSSGNYLGTVAFAETGTSLFDLLGDGGQGDGTFQDEWWVGITDSFAGSATSIIINFAFGGWPIR